MVWPRRISDMPDSVKLTVSHSMISAGFEVERTAGNSDAVVLVQYERTTRQAVESTKNVIINSFRLLSR